MSQVLTKHIADLAVTRGKLEADIIDGSKLADDSVDSEHIVDGSIDSAHLSAGAMSGVLGSKFQAFWDTKNNFSASAASSDAITDAIITESTTKKYDGDSTKSGVVTDSPDNRCMIVAYATRDPIQDSSGREVFGRIAPAVTGLTGTVDATNGNANILGSSTLFTSELATGNYIRVGTSTRLYKVSTITDDTHLALTETFQEATVTGQAIDKIIITISYLVWNGSSEVSHTMSAVAINVMFPESVSIYDAPFNSPLTGGGFSETLAGNHTHDDRYYTETELNSDTGTTGASLIGVDTTGFGNSTNDTVQEVLADLDDAIDAVTGSVTYTDVKTIATLNTVPDLTYTPVRGASVLMFAPPPQRNGFDFTVATKAVTWSASNAGFDLAVSDVVWFSYETMDTIA